MGQKGISVWLIDDGELHWIAARNEDEARQCYQSVYEEQVPPDAEIEMVSEEELNKKMVITDENFPKKISLRELLHEADSFPVILASSVW